MAVTVNRAAGPGRPAQQAFAGNFGVALALVLGRWRAVKTRRCAGKCPTSSRAR